MAIIANLDMMPAKRKMTSLEFSQRIGITPANPSILKTGKAKAIRMSTLEAVAACAEPLEVIFGYNNLPREAPANPAPPSGTPSLPEKKPYPPAAGN